MNTEILCHKKVPNNEENYKNTFREMRLNSEILYQKMFLIMKKITKIHSEKIY